MYLRNQIRERLEDAHLLWRAGRKNGAFLLGLVSLAAVSRLRYPRDSSPRIYFDKMRLYHPSQVSQINERERKRKKGSMYDGEAFKCMLLDIIGDVITPNVGPGQSQLTTNIAIPFGPDRKKTNIEDIFYNFFRNPFVHEGQLTPQAYLTRPTSGGDLVVLTDPTGVPEGWIPKLLAALSKTPELA